MSYKTPKDLLESLKTLAGERHNHKVVQTIPMKALWIQMLAEIEALESSIYALQAECESKNNLLHATIENELKIFDKDIQIDLDTNMIEILECEEENK